MGAALNEIRGRRVCWVLAAVDAALGGTAALFPGTYLRIAHPHLPAAEYPVDWVVRTGVLWLVFLVVEVCAARSGVPAKWFFCVAVLRLMEVPADLAYGVLARGASEVSRLMIFAAPFGNAVAGTFLLIVYRRLSQSVKTGERPPGRTAR